MRQPAVPEANDLPVTEVRIELRREERFPCPSEPALPLLARPSYQVLKARVANVSSGGLGLVVDRPLDAGTLLALEVPGTKPGQTRIQSARVVHATDRGDGTWLIGCKLSSRFTPDEMSQLLGQTRRPGA